MTMKSVLIATMVVSAAAQFAPNRCSPDGTAGSLHGCFFWEIPNTDCLPGNELGNCTSKPPPYTIQECKDTCRDTPNCGGFNFPNGHLKKLGCFEEMQPWPTLPPSTEHPHGRPALSLHVLNQYPPKREYWWRLESTTCNNKHNELGNCTMTAPKNATAKELVAFNQRYRDHCKKVCTENPFCEGFNLPQGKLKAVGCKDDIQPMIGRKVTLYYRRGHPQFRSASAATNVHKYEGVDCNPGQELGNCSSYLPPPYTETECKEACLRNPLCGGWNLPNGHLKATDCDQNIATDRKEPWAPEATVLYVFGDEN